MTVHVHELAGCTPVPLGSYLKALGILRLVSEQADDRARAWWRNERFWLATELDRQQLESFFLDGYEPTPILSPWNLGSGFYYENDPPLTAMEKSTGARFGHLRTAIQDAREATRDFAAAIRRTKELKERVATLKKEAGAREANELARLEELLAEAQRVQAARKESLLGVVRRRWRGASLRWFDAAVVLGADGQAMYPALLGTGGNDKRLDFTNNNLQHLARLFDLGSPAGAPTDIAKRELQAALFGIPVPGLERKAVGQFAPGRAGGANMSSGFEGTSLANSWDFVLMLEGALLLASGAVKRMATTEPVQAAAPFAVRARAAGYPAATAMEESGRGEQWMPLWSSPATGAELLALFREGRARIGAYESTTPVDFARALARLGVARGVEAFERYGYIERNGQANLAVPLGRWRVAPQPHQRLLDEIAGWTDRLRKAARDDKAPGSWRSAACRCDEAMLDVCRNGRDAARWQRLLVALGDTEGALVASARRTAESGLRPIPPLSPDWVRAADDGSAELRLAVALASQHGTWPGGTHPVREHWTPIDSSGSRFASAADMLAIGPDVVCFGEDLERDCIALLFRRSIRARSPWKPQPGDRRAGRERLPLVAPHALAARLPDVHAFLSRRTIDRKIVRLARALAAVRWRDWQYEPLARPADPEPPDAIYSVFRLAHLAQDLVRGEERIAVAVDPEVAARLATGNLRTAAEIALRRLRASGLRPVLRRVAGSRALARRIAASLAFPLHPVDIAAAADAITKPYEAEAS